MLDQSVIWLFLASAWMEKDIILLSLYSDSANWHRAEKKICICPTYLVVFHISCIRQRGSANLSCTQDWYALYLAMNNEVWQICFVFLFYLDRLNHLDQHATALWHSNIWHGSFFSDWWTVLISIASYYINFYWVVAMFYRFKWECVHISVLSWEKSEKASSHQESN